jgi:aromatic-amino-acid transaminase
VLTDPALRSAWTASSDAMRTRILSMRRRLHAVLRAKMPGRDFDYVLTQRGMFSYTGCRRRKWTACASSTAST